MATRAKPPTPQRAVLSLEQMQRGVRRLEKRISEVEAFDPHGINRSDPRSSVRPLSTSVESALSETFEEGTIEHNRFRGAASFDWPISMSQETPTARIVGALVVARQRSLDLLRAAVDLLKERIEEANADASVMSTAAEAPSPEPTAPSARIFIVHGHDEGPREAIARFVATIGFEPVILHEQANRGKTIIAKFRAEAADVGFAIVAMTPDDVLDPQDPTKSRARQNVILELGFFLGALGPERVAVVRKGPIDTPSDYDGVVYIPFEADWRVQLAREMQAAGYQIDWNTVMGI